MNFKSLIGTLLLASAVVACDRAQAPTDAPAAPPADGATQAVQNDPMADPLTAESVAIALESVSKPAMDPASGQLRLDVKVTNNGKRILSGTGKYPVNLGVQVVGDDGTVASTGGLADFVRVPLPEIAPGASANLSVLIPVDPRVDGRTLSMDLVQEGVSWFSSGFGQPVLSAGPFKICGQSFCDVAGVPL